MAADDTALAHGKLVDEFIATRGRAGTDLFLTNDKRLVGKIVPGIQFVATLDTPLF